MIKKYKDFTYQETTPIRLDVFLTPLLSYSRSHLAKKIKNHEIKVNDLNVLPSYLLKNDDKIRVFLDQESGILESDQRIEVLYEDQYLAVINKPKGMTTHPSKGHHDDTLVNALISKMELSSDAIRPGIVHRLDKDTSGLLLIAKDNLTHTILQSEIEKRLVSREYLLLVHGKVTEKHFFVEGKIGKDPKNFRKMAIVDDGKEAKTEFNLVEQLGDYSLLSAKLYTGRTHQIRVHISKIGFPIVGDELYGHPSNITKNGQLLVAYRLAFTHPITYVKKLIQVEPDPEFKRVLSVLSKE